MRGFLKAAGVVDHESRLADWLGDERQAVTLAPHVNVTETASDVELETAVIRVLCTPLESMHENDVVEYAGGQRRDTLRSGR